jgi:naringenin degradation protein FdeH
MPSIRRVITGHDVHGKSIIIDDRAAPNSKIRPASGNLVSTLLWVTDETPADISGVADRADRVIAVAPPANGTIFRVVDFPPEAPEISGVSNTEVLKEMGLEHPSDLGRARHPLMHRTKSVDYAVVMSGEIYMLLDDSEVLLRAGDTVIQQGTHHSWSNRSHSVCRIAFVLIDALQPSTWAAHAAT